MKYKLIDIYSINNMLIFYICMLFHFWFCMLFHFYNHVQPNFSSKMSTWLQTVQKSLLIDLQIVRTGSKVFFRTNWIHVKRQAYSSGSTVGRSLKTLGPPRILCFDFVFQTSKKQHQPLKQKQTSNNQPNHKQSRISGISFNFIL